LKDNQDITLLQSEFFAVWALDGVTFEGPKCDIMREIQTCIHSGAVDDMVTKVIMNLSASEGKSLRTDEWKKVDGLWYFHDKLYVPNIPDLRRQIAEQHHDLKITGHAGHWKTIELVV
jgi:hypothetical protein